MKYFIDTEFIEGFHKPLFGRRRHFIDLISIGIVAEDGREYYAISNEFDEKRASDWVKENVINSIVKSFHGDKRNYFLDISIKGVKNCFGKSNKQIASEILEFVNPAWLGIPCDKADPSEHSESTKHFIELHNAKAFDMEGIFDCWFAQPEFYGHYSDYDWVLFCSLFGTMMDLPKGFPMYCRDLKQMLDETIKNIDNEKWANLLDKLDADWKKQNKTGIELLNFNENNFEEKIVLFKSLNGYPQQTNEHNALADARWNFELYKFLGKA